MNRVMNLSVLCGVIVMGAACLQAEEAKPATDAASTNKAVATGKAQTTCPVMKGNPIDKNLFVDKDGKRIYVCCKGCIKPVKKDFAKYVKQLEADGITLEDAPATPAKTTKPPVKAE